MFLLTDYGLDDEFAGVLRAVVLRSAPGAVVVDLTHGIPPFDVRAGAAALVRSAGHLGPGVVVAVVDPGVGSTRRAVALELAGVRGAAGSPRHLVGPDNGLLLPAAQLLGGVVDAVELARDPEEGAATFDGRDVFAPAAARLWSGEPIATLGRRIDPATLVSLPAPRLAVAPGRIEAEVTWVDRFGNAALVAVAADLEASGLADTEAFSLEVVSHGPPPQSTAGAGSAGSRHSGIRRVRSFADIADGQLGVLVDANGHLALACRGTSAATVLGVTSGSFVCLMGGTTPAAPDRGGA